MEIVHEVLSSIPSTIKFQNKNPAIKCYFDTACISISTTLFQILLPQFLNVLCILNRDLRNEENIFCSPLQAPPASLSRVHLSAQLNTG